MLNTKTFFPGIVSTVKILNYFNNTDTYSCLEETFRIWILHLMYFSLRDASTLCSMFQNLNITSSLCYATANTSTLAEASVSEYYIWCEATTIQYVIFVILLTPAPFSTDTKNTLIPDFLTPKNTKFMIFTPKQNNSHFFDTGLKILTPAPLVVLVTNIRYVDSLLAHVTMTKTYIKINTKTKKRENL